MLPPMNLPPAPVAASPPKLDQAAVTATLQRAEEALKQRRIAEAMGICSDLLETVPDHPAALALLGAIYGHRGDYQQGITLLRRACERVPDSPSWLNNLSSLCRIACRFDESLAAIERALQLAPNNAALVLNLAKLRMDRGDYAEATDAFLQILANEPGNAEAHLALGQIQLMHGDLHSGWLEYEWRNQLEQARGSIPKMVRPQWNGMRLPGRSLLLIGDQGFGDTIQFARFIPLVAERVGRVLFGCAPELAQLLAQVPGIGACYDRWENIPPHSVYCRLSSVPALLGIGAGLIPGPMPYLFGDAAVTAQWHARLAERFPNRRPRIGIVWAGRPTHPNDQRRSLRLAQLASVTSLPGIDFVSLQKVVAPHDAQAFATFKARPNVFDAGPELADFGVTASILANIDLLVTVDSSIAHLAGALGHRAWVLVSRPSDWRWLLEREDSPWYPGMRLFRQPQAGDWDTTIAALAGALVSLAQPVMQLEAV